jgi:hypothetical protein
MQSDFDHLCSEIDLYLTPVQIECINNLFKRYESNTSSLLEEKSRSMATTIRDDLMAQKRSGYDETFDKRYDYVDIEDIQSYFKDRFNV